MRKAVQLRVAKVGLVSASLAAVLMGLLRTPPIALGAITGRSRTIHAHRSRRSRTPGIVPGPVLARRESDGDPFDADSGGLQTWPRRGWLFGRTLGSVVAEPCNRGLESWRPVAQLARAAELFLGEVLFRERRLRIVAVVVISFFSHSHSPRES